MGVELDGSQRAVLELPEGASAVVIGAPGSGKTETLLALAADRVHTRGYDAAELLVITGSRHSATELRDRLARELAVVTTGPLARTASSVAFELATAQARAHDAAPPRLLSGADQDLMIRELLQGHLDDGRGPVWPEHLDAVVRRLPTFRVELRELLMRATEFGVSPAELRRLGQTTGRPAWVAAADFAVEYQTVLASARGEMLDPAELGAAAVHAIEDGHLGERLSRVRLVLVDELQQATETTMRMLRALAERGVTIIGFGDPDTASNSFRGGEVDAVGGFGVRLGNAATPRLVLSRVHRHGPAIRQVISEITARIGTAGEGTQRAAESVVADAVEHPLLAIREASPGAHAEAIARVLRERHLLDGVPWNQLAVVTRTARAIPGLARALALAHVPTRTLAGGTALRDDLAAGALLRVVEVAIGRAPLTGTTAEELLLGPFGGLDAVALRRLRLTLRAEELAGGGARHGGELLAEALAAPGRLATVDHAVGRRAARVAEVLDRIRAQNESGASAEELLWTAWEGSGVAATWEQRARGAGLAAEEANRALDGIVALFASARRFAERAPHSSAAAFLAEVLDAEVPEDTLAPQALADTVLVATPAGAGSLEFDTVVVAGLQDGQWPNLRLRGSLLGAGDLVAVLRGQVAESASAVDERRAVLADELRIFALACSRARARLVVAAIQSDDEAPSPLFELVADPDRGGADPVEADRSPLGLRPLVGRLRRTITTSGTRDELRAAATAALVALAIDGVPGAHPDDWRGLLPVSTEAPLVDLAEPEARVGVSPSRIEAIERSPMEAFVEQMGGGSTSPAVGMGTLIHDVLEHATGHNVDELQAALDERWGELHFESEWDALRQRTVARTAIAALARYLADFEARGGELVSAEGGFELDVAPARLRGKIDRVESHPEGLVIMDLKTGSFIPSASAAAEHPQLGAYQLAHAEGALEGGGDVPLHEARLVYTSSTSKKLPYTVRPQAAFDDEAREAFRERVRAAARAMTGPEFEAVLTDDAFAHGSEIRAVQLPPEVSSD